MYTQLKIAGDAHTWTLSSPLDPSTLTGDGSPLSLDVTNPLEGVMVLSPSAAGSVTLLPGAVAPVTPQGWIPGDEKTRLPFVYLPGTGGTSPQDMYPLPSATDRDALTDEIAAAMEAGTRFSLSCGSSEQDGTLVLNGAALPFAVVTEAIPA